MCGLVGLRGPVPPAMVKAAVLGAGRRGPHSHGVATLAEDGLWAVSRSYRRLLALPEWRPLIGHSRLATSTQAPGDAPPLEESMPFTAGRWCLAHNGNIPDASALCGREVPVDSWAILHLLVEDRVELAILHDFLRRVAPNPQAFIIGRGERLFCVRVKGRSGTPAHPIYTVREEGWAAASSGPLPRGRLAPEGVSEL